MVEYPLNRVAVIGAGISGVVSAAYLLLAGVEVVVFERNKAAGGVWLYDERQPIEPVYPSIKPSKAEELGSGPDDDERRLFEHAPPGPCYDGLTSNLPTQLMHTKLNAWPYGTPDLIGHEIARSYIQDTSEKAGVDAVIRYGARVTNLQKTGSTWQVTWSTLQPGPQTGKLEERKETSIFDAVVVASGHYHAPHLPDIPGLSDCKARWPARVWHSKRYRKPKGFDGKRVLLIGGGTSSVDIARELGPVAKEVYQSTRNGPFDLPPQMLPENGFRIGEIDAFEIQGEAMLINGLLDHEPLPITIHLKSGQRLCEIHLVIICTGYHITLPFLGEYHEDETSPSEASDTVLVTNGTQFHNLHKDIFYIPDPTLAFVGVPYYNVTFTLFEFQAIVVAAVFSGRAKLPTEASMREEYRARIRRKGTGKAFHSLRDDEEDYVKDLLNWINNDQAARGFPPVEGHSPAWVKARKEHMELIRRTYGNPLENRNILGNLPVPLQGNCP